jgi:hypothetical protein
VRLDHRRCDLKMMSTTSSTEDLKGLLTEGATGPPKVRPKDDVYDIID